MPVLDMAMSDHATAAICNLARKCGVVIIVKGTDENPVVLVKAKCVGKARHLWPAVNGLELSKRIRRATAK
jgi:hypothetical protein